MKALHWTELLKQMLILVFLFSVSSCSITVVGDATIYAGLIRPNEDNTTSFPNAIKCFVCTGKDNDLCNVIAVDAYCPQGTRFCYTQHTFNTTTGDSEHVIKKCAKENECIEHTVGCFSTLQSDIRRCLSCCEWTRCNEDVPTNSSTAILSTLTPLTIDNSSHQIYSSTKLIFLLILCTVYVVVFR